MVKLILRDDDMNFYTRPEDIESVYNDISLFPVSFAVVPRVVSCGEKCPETRGNTEPRWVGDNVELISYLKERLNNNSCDVLLHGLTHEYHYYGGRKVSEMIWREKEAPETLQFIAKNKEDLSSLLGFNINCFAAPHNDIGKLGIQSVYHAGMNFSGIVPISYDRDISFRGLTNYLKRVGVRLFRGIPYPGILDYGTHLELNACNSIQFDFLMTMYNYCERYSLPMAINVHYWHMRDNAPLYKDLFRFVHVALDKGAIPSRMSDVLSAVN